MREQMDTVQAYIKQKDYLRAWKIARRIDHPKARQWTDKLAEQPVVMRWRWRKRITTGALIALVLFLLVMAIRLHQSGMINVAL